MINWDFDTEEEYEIDNTIRVGDIVIHTFHKTKKFKIHRKLLDNFTGNIYCDCVDENNKVFRNMLITKLKKI